MLGLDLNTQTPEHSGLNLSPSCLSLCAKMFFKQQVSLARLDVFGGWKLSLM